MSLAEESYDFGQVALEQMVEAVYRFTNVGDSPLVLGPPLVRVLEGC